MIFGKYELKSCFRVITVIRSNGGREEFCV
jgi:hypothetical protein